MRKFEQEMENGLKRPYVEFTPEEISAMDKEFLNKVYTRSKEHHRPQVLYKHRAFEDFSEDRVSHWMHQGRYLRTHTNKEVYEYLVDVCSILAHNARILKLLIDEDQKPEEKNA